MPKQKDLKRLIRARMEKTGESYTAARSRILKQTTPPSAEFARLAGMTDDAVRAVGGAFSANEILSITVEAGAIPLAFANADFDLSNDRRTLTITLDEATDGAFLTTGAKVEVTFKDDTVSDLAGVSLADRAGGPRAVTGERVSA